MQVQYTGNSLLRKKLPLHTWGWELTNHINFRGITNLSHYSMIFFALQMRTIYQMHCDGLPYRKDKGEFVAKKEFLQQWIIGLVIVTKVCTQNAIRWGECLQQLHSVWVHMQFFANIRHIFVAKSSVLGWQDV